MLVAQLRGVKFKRSKGKGSWEPVGAVCRSFTALDDVAAACGYCGSFEYNQACRTNPDEVRARLAAL